MKKVLFTLAMFGIATMMNTNKADACSVTIAEMNWASGEFIANVDAAILEKGYGCDVEIVPGATMTTFAAMDSKGNPDLASELWANAVREPLAKAVSEGRLKIVNKEVFAGAGEGWWIPEYMHKKHPELKTVLDIIKRPDLFPHPEDPGKGGLVTCPAGWGCQLVTDNLFRAFKMADNGWKLVLPGSAAGLDGSITKAHERREPWFGYYWSPTSILGKYPMYKVPYGVPYDAEGWDNCIVKPEHECADPKPSAFTHSEVMSVATADFVKSVPSAVVSYVDKRSFDVTDVNVLIAWMADNQADGETAAIHFLNEHEKIWRAWVPSSVAKKIKSSLY